MRSSVASWCFRAAVKITHFLWAIRAWVKPPSPRALHAVSSMKMCQMCWRMRRSILWIWARSSRVHVIAVISKNVSRPLSRSCKRLMVLCYLLMKFIQSSAQVRHLAARWMRRTFSSLLCKVVSCGVWARQPIRNIASISKKTVRCLVVS